MAVYCVFLLQGCEHHRDCYIPAAKNLIRTMGVDEGCVKSASAFENRVVKALNSHLTETSKRKPLHNKYSITSAVEVS